MSSILIPRRFYSQPPGVVRVNWNNPITKGLLVAFKFDLGAVNLATGERWTETSMSSVASPLGAGLKATSPTTGNITGPTMNMARLPDVPNDTLSVCWGLGNVQLANWRQMWGQSDAVADAYIVQLTAAGAIQVKFGGGASFFTSDGVLTAGESCHLALVIKNSAGCNLVKNGRTVLHNSAAYSNPINTSATPHIFGASANTRRLDSQIPYWYMFGRILSDDEVVSLADNPWQIFTVQE